MGYVFGVLGVGSFSLTLPATRVAVQSIDPIFVSSGRAVIAAVIGGLCLAFARAARPRGVQWVGVAVVSLCLGILFPTCASLGARDATAAHGAVILGLLPLFTTLAGMLRVGERPSVSFWLAGLLGSAAVIAFALWENGGRTVTFADGVLLLAAIVASFGYAESARLAPALGSWQIVCWALILVAPVNVVIAALRWSAHPTPDASVEAWASLAYVATMSQLFGVMLWTHGLKLGGVSRVGQLQLLMPFMTFVASALWLREALSLSMVAAAAAVLVSILLSRRAGVQRASGVVALPRPSAMS